MSDHKGPTYEGTLAPYMERSSMGVYAGPIYD